MNNSIFLETKSLRSSRGVGNLGLVEVQVLDVPPMDLVNPDSSFQISLKITNKTRKVIFDEVRVSLKEVKTWASIIPPKHGNNTTRTEMTELASMNYESLEKDTIDYGKRVQLLHNISLDVPENAKCDQELGLVRVHHFLQVKIISHGGTIRDLRFRFPFVIGGAQYKEAVPADHPVNSMKKIRPSKALANGIAKSTMLLSNSGHYFRASA
jgi:hypothetical protein